MFIVFSCNHKPSGTLSKNGMVSSAHPLASKVGIEILKKGSATANESMLSTKEMLSKKGRSSKLGERSKGHIDPGAASSALIFRTFHEAVQNL